LGWDLESPISILERESVIGRGKVIVITNTSNEHLHECSITVNNLKNENATLPTIKPHESQKIGWLELGYELRTGDKIQVNCKGVLLPSSTILK
jgi:hypothetical protein